MEQPPPLASVPVPAPQPKPAPVRVVRASWYGPGFIGRPTSSGERFNPNLLTAASTSIPMGSIVRLMNIDNGRTVDVRINDCGPFVPGRSLDLSHRAAKQLGMERKGVASVRLMSVHSPPDASPPCNF
jgi:rare lipoprotein A